MTNLDSSLTIASRVVPTSVQHELLRAKASDVAKSIELEQRIVTEIREELDAQRQRVAVLQTQLSAIQAQLDHIAAKMGRL